VPGIFVKKLFPAQGAIFDTSDATGSQTTNIGGQRRQVVYRSNVARVPAAELGGEVAGKVDAWYPAVEAVVASLARTVGGPNAKVAVATMLVSCAPARRVAGRRCAAPRTRQTFHTDVTPVPGKPRPPVFIIAGTDGVELLAAPGSGAVMRSIEKLAEDRMAAALSLPAVRPIVFKLRRGDIVIFSGDTVHAGGLTPEPPEDLPEGDVYNHRAHWYTVFEGEAYDALRGDTHPVEGVDHPVRIDLELLPEHLRAKPAAQ
jgi:hypothetical protein